jgi:hypothetical protein
MNLYADYMNAWAELSMEIERWLQQWAWRRR